MNDFGKTKFCLGLQIEHPTNEICIHQSTYTKNVLKWFYMVKSHPLSTLMVVRFLDINKDLFRPQKKDKEFLDDETSYPSAIEALMYLVINTWPDTCFAISLFVRFISCQTRRHWKDVNHIITYLRGTIDMRFLYSNASTLELIDYADAGYSFDPHKTRSQTSYLFTYRGITILWRSIKQTIVSISSNHAEIIVIHEATTRN